MTTEFVFVSNVDADAGEPNAKTGLRNRAGKLYLLGKQPSGQFTINQVCCATKARRFRLGLSIEEFNDGLQALKHRKIDFF